VVASLLAIVGSGIPGARALEVSVWERDGLEGKQVRQLALALDSSAMLALIGGSREASPLWIRQGEDWSQPAGPLPGFILTMAPLPDGGVLLGTGRDITDQPGVFLAAGAELSARRLYDVQAIGALAVGSPVPAVRATNDGPSEQRISQRRLDPVLSAALRDSRGPSQPMPSGTPVMATATPLAPPTSATIDPRFDQPTTLTRGRLDVFAASAPWADRDAGSELLRRDAGSGSWSAVLRPTIACGPTPSYFRHISVAPSKSSTLFAIESCVSSLGSGSQIWRSDDRGQTWQVLRHPSSALPVVTSLAVDPTDADALYLVGVAPGGRPIAGIERSQDGGKTWILRGDAQEGLTSARALLVDPRAPQRLLVATDQNGVFASDDRGDSWRSRPGLEGLRIWSLALDEATGFVHAATSDGVWKTALP
jgi:hypothetical protein